MLSCPSSSCFGLILGRRRRIRDGRSGVSCSPLDKNRGREIRGTRVRHREGGLDSIAHHARLAGSLVGSRRCLNNQITGEARTDVLDLADDLKPIGTKQIELGDVVAACSSP